MATITSRHHTLVKEFRRVARGDEPRLALLDGWHLLEEAVRARLTVTHIAMVDGIATPAVADAIDHARDNGASIHSVSTSVLSALSPVRAPSGIVAIVERRPARVSQLLTPLPSLIVLAIDMQDPGNVGAVIRSAEAGGATGVAFTGASADAWSWKALRAAMGSTFRVPLLATDNVADFIQELRSSGVKIVATVPRGGTAMHAMDMRGPIAILIGGEGAGLPATALRSADGSVSIPMNGAVESLNAAVAAALLVYEARRQREEGAR